jgi:6-phosphogluconolactonase (cycloisomerase 2 family)
MIAAALTALTGCGDFFVKPTSGGGGGTTSNRVYVANSATSTIAGFTIGTATLTAVPNSPLALGYAPTAAVVTPAYSVQNAAVAPKAIRVAPNGALVFAALGSGGDIVFTLNTTSGALVNSQTLAPTSTTTSDNGLAIDSTTSHLYIARSGTSGGVAVYTIGSGGVLNSVNGSPFAAGAQTMSVVLDTTGKYVYAANRGDNTISGYSIGTSSTLSALSGSPYASGSQVTSLGVDKSGKYLLAAAFGGSPDLSMYSFDTAVPGKLNLATSTATGTGSTGATAVALTH